MLKETEQRITPVIATLNNPMQEAEELANTIRVPELCSLWSTRNCVKQLFERHGLYTTT
uniref:Uncharacterized protein n=1 Tax=Physcomitrium patens TaxID=3218 RepID=A0A2K1J810_PHYPA|nr:hypothetical protein PHYPA_020772 [Physcomitrium patens]